MLLQVSTVTTINSKPTNTQRHPSKYKITREMGRTKSELLGLGDNYRWHWCGSVLIGNESSLERFQGHRESQVQICEGQMMWTDFRCCDDMPKLFHRKRVPVCFVLPNWSTE